MKVIAQIDSSKVLCEVSHTEIAKLHCVSGPYDKAWDSAWVKVGAEHDMAEIFKAVDDLRGFDRSQLHYMQQRVNSMNETFAQIKEAYEKLMLFDTLKEDLSDES
jgi:hypothetical protein